MNVVTLAPESPPAGGMPSAALFATTVMSELSVRAGASRQQSEGMVVGAGWKGSTNLEFLEKACHLAGRLRRDGQDRHRIHRWKCEAHILYG